MNIWTKLGSSASAARIRLMTTCFSKPSGPCDWARKISAIPPSASLRRMTYRPTGVPGARDTGPSRRGRLLDRGPRRAVPPGGEHLDGGGVEVLLGVEAPRAAPGVGGRRALEPGEDAHRP